MERSQRIQKTATRRVALNLSLSGLTIEPNEQGGDIIMFGSSPSLCKSCGVEVAPGIGCC